jgi:BirA family biotin operon repressor/biotin-[acetyl-CoA-carboxylase] ligase
MPLLENKLFIKNVVSLKITNSLQVPLINNVIGNRFIELLRLDSTNNYAMQQVQNGAAMHGDVYFAFEQTTGKGQFDKQWLSAKGQNIILSVVLDTSAFHIKQQFILNMITALSVMQLFNIYTTEKIKIKFPNDVYCNDRKAAGILIENLVRGMKWQYAIVGIGANINQTSFDDTLKNPVSLKQITGKNYNVVMLAKELCALLNENLKHLYVEDGKFVSMVYNNCLYKRNEIVKFKQRDQLFFGLVKEVDSFGNIVIVDNGIEKTFQSGQIEWLH